MAEDVEGHRCAPFREENDLHTLFGRNGNRGQAKLLFLLFSAHGYIYYRVYFI